MRAYDACIDVRKKGGSHGAVRQFCEQNFISPTTLRDITSLRSDFLSALSSLGFMSSSSSAAELAKYNVNAKVDNLVKGVVVGGLYPRVVKIAMPKAQFERVQQGTVQKDVSRVTSQTITSFLIRMLIHDCDADPRLFMNSTKQKRSNSTINLVVYSFIPALSYLQNPVSNPDI